MKFLMTATLGPNLRKGMVIDFDTRTLALLEETHGERTQWCTLPHLEGRDDGLEEERTALFSAEE